MKAIARKVHAYAITQTVISDTHSLRKSRSLRRFLVSRIFGREISSQSTIADADNLLQHRTSHCGGSQRGVHSLITFAKAVAFLLHGGMVSLNTKA